MNMLPFKSHSAIGLDFGSRTVKAVQLSTGKLGLEISSATIFPRALPDAAISSDEVRRLIDVLYRHNFYGRNVVLAAPPMRLLDGTLELPKAGPDATGLDQIARMEFARLQKCEPTAIEMGFWSLPAGPRTHQAHRVMAMGCLHRDVDPLLDVFESEGLHVAALDAEACALARATESRWSEMNGLCGILDFGWTCSRLAVVYQGAIVFSRVLSDSGMHPLFASLEKHLEIDQSMVEQVLGELASMGREASDEDMAADARRPLQSHFDTIVQELNLSFSYATQQYPDAEIQNLLLTGGGAEIPGLIEHLSKQLEITVTPLAPRDVLACRQGMLERCASPALMLAVGLAQFGDA